MDSIPRTSGIYVILNTKNQKVYIGKTATGFNSRWKSHKKALDGGYHHNCHLQAAWNKYGAKAFQFFKLEHCTIDELNEREKHHIAIYKARGLAYNQTNGGDGALGHIPNAETRLKMSLAQKGRIISPDARQRISKANKGRKMSEANRVHNSIRQKGRTPPAHVLAASNAACEKMWILTNPNHEEITIKNLTRFCRENGLDQGHMSRVAQGKLKTHKGWKCRLHE